MMKLNSHALSVFVTVGLLAGMTAARLRRPAAADAEPYHQQVRAAAESIPYEFGNWLGTDQEIPPAAIRLLQPNVLLSREYRNSNSGTVATLLLVHCRDARDLAGHYPPVCYPSHGWTLEYARPRQWDGGDLSIHGTEYSFHFKTPAAVEHKVVANFMILPSGQILGDIEGVRHAAADYTRHFYGAAQIQLVIDASVTTAERDAILYEVVGAIRPVIDAVSGAPID